MMKKMTSLLAALMLSVSFSVNAAEEKIFVDVNGLVCDFCARALEKVFSRQDAVEDIDVDLNAKVVTIDVKDGKNLSDERTAELVSDAGYNVVAIRRGQ